MTSKTGNMYKVMGINPSNKDIHEIDLEKYKSHHKKPKIRKTPTLLLDGHYFDTWGHFILDDLYPFYLLWKSLSLKPGTFNILCRDNSYIINNWDRISQIIIDLFQPKNVINIESLKGFTVFKRLYRNEKPFGFFNSDPTGSLIQSNLKEHFKEVGFKLDESFKSENISQDLNNFIDHCIQTYGLKEVKMESGLVTLSGRTYCRKIKNLNTIAEILKQQGYTVDIIYFETLSFRDQIRQMLKSEFLISSYGSNITNGIFLHSEAKFIVCWPYDAKCFWSRKYCILHSGILCRGVTIHEFDKSLYDQTDNYLHLNQLSGPESYFYRDNNVIKLRDEKKTYPDIMDYPQPASYDLLNVDFTIDLNRFLNLSSELKRDIIIV